MPYIRVEKHYTKSNYHGFSIDMRIKMSVFDRLKFLLYGDECIFQFHEREFIKNAESAINEIAEIENAATDFLKQEVSKCAKK